MPHPPASPARGILSAAAPEAEGTTHHLRLLPSAALAPVVAHYWQVTWMLHRPFLAETLPHPSFHIVFERHGGEGRAELSGVHTHRFTKTLHGEGWAFGIKLRPGASCGVVDRPASSFKDRVTPVIRVFGARGAVLARAILAAEDMGARIALAESFLIARARPLPPEAERLRDLVERIERDRAILRVSDAATILGTEIRALQRSFRRYVGATPKWVVCRYRLHEAAERLRSAHPPSLAELAASLGYADQAHFARDFRLAVGRTPRDFARLHRDGGAARRKGALEG